MASANENPEIVTVVLHDLNKEIKCKVIQQGDQTILVECQSENGNLLDINAAIADEIFQCTVCASEFENISDLEIHIDKNHRSNKHLVTNKTVEQNTIARTEAIGTSNNGFNCITCDTNYSTANELELHTRLHEPYVCEGCSLTFQTMFDLREHIVRQHDQNYKKALTNCPICNWPATSENTLVRHMTNHVDVLRLVCRICSQAFRSKNSLWSHLRFVHKSLLPSVNIEARQCSVCGLILKNLMGLKCHLKKHSTKKIIKCEICLKYFANHEQLGCHVSENHSKFAQTQTMCKFCPQLVAIAFYKQHTKMHMTHYFCELCVNAYPTCELLTQHRLSAHPTAADHLFMDELLEKDEEYRTGILASLEEHQQT